MRSPTRAVSMPLAAVSQGDRRRGVCVEVAQQVYSARTTTSRDFRVWLRRMAQALVRAAGPSMREGGRPLGTLAAVRRDCLGARVFIALARGARSAGVFPLGPGCGRCADGLRSCGPLVCSSLGVRAGRRREAMHLVRALARVAVLSFRALLALCFGHPHGRRAAGPRAR